jgi:hypothetical protein
LGGIRLSTVYVGGATGFALAGAATGGRDDFERPAGGEEVRDGAADGERRAGLGIFHSTENERSPMGGRHRPGQFERARVALSRGTRQRPLRVP